MSNYVSTFAHFSGEDHPDLEKGTYVVHKMKRTKEDFTVILEEKFPKSFDADLFTYTAVTKDGLTHKFTPYPKLYKEQNDE